MLKFGLLLIFLPLLFCESSFAMGKKRRKVVTPDFNDKRIIELLPINGVKIELPDRETREFGEDFRSRLQTYLQNTGKYVIKDVTARPYKASVNCIGVDDDCRWESFDLFPAGQIKIHVEALTFRTGSKGTRMVYGFDERTRNEFNDGSSQFSNEFPLRGPIFDATWFGPIFNRIGSGQKHSQAGLEMGAGFELDALFAYLKVKQAQYHAELKLRVEIIAP